MTESPEFAREWTLTGDYGSEKDVLCDITSVLHAIDPGSERLDDIRTVIAESCLNAFEHGGRSSGAGGDRGDGGSDGGSGGGEGPVTVRMQVDAGRYLFQICDCGQTIPDLPESADIGDNWLAEHPRGWGLMFIRELSDRFEYNCSGGQFYVEVTFYR